MSRVPLSQDTLLPGAGGFGRGAPAASGVGEPFEGAVTLKEREARLAAPPPPPPTAAQSPDRAAVEPLRPDRPVRERHHGRRKVSFDVCLQRR